MEAESPDRFRGLGGTCKLEVVEPELVAGPRPVLMQMPVERPVWVEGTLPGMMAGKRPSPSTMRLS